MAEKDKEYKTPDLAKLYSKPGRAMPTIWNFRVLRVRPGERKLDVSEFVESMDWGDGGTYGEGSLVLIKPDTMRNWHPVTMGDRVQIDAEYRGRWYQLVTMRVDGFPESSTADGSLSIAMKDDLALLTVQKRDWRYRKTKSRGRGWFPGEIARDVAKKEGLRVGEIFRGAHRIDKLEKKDTFGLDVIFEAYNREKAKTGQRYQVRIHNNKLEVRPWARQVIVYVAEESIEDASVSRATRPNPATVWLGKGRVGKGAKARKVKFRYKRQELVRRYGMKEKEKDYGRVDSEAALRRQVKADYAEEVKVNKTGSVTLTGIPFVRGAWGSMRKGEGIKIVLPGEGMTGKHAWVWTRSVQHSVSGSGYTVAIEFEEKDPWLAYEEEVDKAQRDRKRRDRKGATK